MPVVLQIIPMGAVRMTQRSKWAPNAQRYLRYKGDIKEQMGADYLLPESVGLEFALPMPPSWSKKRRDAMRGTVHQSKPDIDNLVKGFMDAFGTDDSHVHTIAATKLWDDEGSITVLDL